MYYETMTPKGEYRCATEAMRMNPLGAERYEYAGKVVSIFLLTPDGQNVEVPVGVGLYEHYGKTYDEACHKAGLAFQEWARKVGGSN